MTQKALIWPCETRKHTSHYQIINGAIWTLRQATQTKWDEGTAEIIRVSRHPIHLATGATRNMQHKD